METPIKLDCGHMSTPTECWPGYASFRDSDRKICAQCAADLDRAYLKEHGKLSVYLTGKEKPETITTWPGIVLGTVTHATKHPARWQGNRWIPSCYSYRATIGGVSVYGRGQLSMHTVARVSRARKAA